RRAAHAADRRRAAVLPGMARGWRAAHGRVVLGAPAGVVRHPPSAERAPAALQRLESGSAGSDAPHREVPRHRPGPGEAATDARALQSRLHASDRLTALAD